jgi:hypothetical protein
MELTPASLFEQQSAEELGLSYSGGDDTSSLLDDCCNIQVTLIDPTVGHPARRRYRSRLL